MPAECLIPNCRNSAPNNEAFCSKHRDEPMRRAPFAFCCNANPDICDCVNPDHGFALFSREKPTLRTPPASQSDEALVEELARTFCRARYGEEIGWEGFIPEARAILHILHRERADAFEAGVCSTFEQRAMDLKDVREAGRREGIEEAAKVAELWAGETCAAEEIRALKGERT